MIATRSINKATRGLVSRKRPGLAAAGPVRRGLTLLELIVVLVILAALGTVIITQTTSLADETRYRQTTATLEQLQDAVIGRTATAGEDPTSVAPGFVADVGRLPRADASLGMSELWDREAPGAGAPPMPFAVQTLTGLDDDLQLACGWRGPYARLPIGSDNLSDGWGRPFTLLKSDGDVVDSAGDNIAAITSAGSGVGDVFDQPLDDVVFEDSSQSIDRTTGQVTLQLVFTLPPGSTDNQAIVRVYGPVNGRAAVVAQSDVITSVAGTTQSVTVEFNPLDISIGPKLLRAYQWDSATAPGTTDDLTSRTKSMARRVTVLAGGATWPDLELEGQ